MPFYLCLSLAYEFCHAQLITDNTGVIVSPEFPTPNGVNCSLLILPPESVTVQMDLVVQEINLQLCNGCDELWVSTETEYKKEIPNKSGYFHRCKFI